MPGASADGVYCQLNAMWASIFLRLGFGFPIRGVMRNAQSSSILGAASVLRPCYCRVTA